MKQQFYYYEGSLTTPNCSEIVNWFITEQIQPCSIKQMDLMKTWLDGNYRLTNPINGRIVYRTKEPEEPKKMGSFQGVCIITALGIFIMILLNCVQLKCKAAFNANVPGAQPQYSRMQ